MSDRVDITMTAMIRPALVNKTLKSFCENVFDEDPERFRLIINIDPLGGRKPHRTVVKICRRYFNKRSMISNSPSEASFPRAVMWVWSQVEADWIFHLEDDWLVNKKININDMISIMKEYKNLACLRLPKFRTPKGKTAKFFSSKYTYNDKGFYVASDRKRQFGLNPVLIRGSFIKEALPLLVDTGNPEKQFRYANKNMRNLVMSWDYGLYTNRGSRPVVTDIGRGWLRKSEFRKPRGKFVTWVKK